MEGSRHTPFCLNLPPLELFPLPIFFTAVKTVNTVNSRSSTLHTVVSRLDKLSQYSVQQVLVPGWASAVAPSGSLALVPSLPDCCHKTAQTRTNRILSQRNTLLLLLPSTITTQLSFRSAGRCQTRARKWLRKTHHGVQVAFHKGDLRYDSLAWTAGLKRRVLATYHNLLTSPNIPPPQNRTCRP